MPKGLVPSPQSSMTRRRLLEISACGFGQVALAALCGDVAQAGQAPRNPLVPKRPPLIPRAKRIIFLFMQGGPSQVDTFDPKPRLDRDDGQKVPFLVARTRKVTPERLFKSPWKFSRHGHCGRWVSELLPHIAGHVDDLCFVQSMHTEGVAHGPATLALHTGVTSLIRPSMGAWVSYGLGTDNQNLPAFITINPMARMGGPRNYGSAFLSPIHQGTPIGRVGVPASQATFRNLTNNRIAPADQRRQLDFVQALNRAQRAHNPDDDQLDAVIHSFELAYRMQTEAPELMDLSRESSATRRLYGIGESATDEYGRQCLLARRLAEAGVRYIQVNYADNSNNPKWDQHANLEKHAVHARAVDKPVAGLLTDLKSRGLLEDTLVWWGGEFGRTPFAQGRDGRDHNPKGFTIWLAGGGVRPGFAYGQTDEFGYKAVVDPVHMHDLHATVLHLLGLDHERLTYSYAGRDFRLTDIHGRVVEELIV